MQKYLNSLSSFQVNIKIFLLISATWMEHILAEKNWIMLSVSTFESAVFGPMSVIQAHGNSLLSHMRRMMQQTFV